MYTIQDIDELEQFFKSVTVPGEIRLSQCEHVTDVPKMIQSHLHTCRVYLNNNTFYAFYDRLVTLKKIISGEISQPKHYQYRAFIDAQKH